jgi:hypothetical protein
MKLIIKTLVSLCLAVLLILSSATRAWAFCGFYVAGADAKLFNESSQVIIAHNEDKTIITMANDFQGAVKDFALVVPVPVAVKREQVNVGDKEILKKLDAFTQPRLVEYNDPSPCDNGVSLDQLNDVTGRRNRTSNSAPQSARTINRDLGVTVEDKFKVNEYEILILSAKESNGLEIWLQRNGYKIPAGASAVLQPYIKQNMKFFVAKVDLKEYESSGNTFLRPIQIAYQSPKFMLPIRLGMLNAKGDQDLIVYMLSPQGQVEVANYRTVKVPTDKGIPEFVKEDFGKFYKSTFQKSYEQANKKVAFMEYAWDTGSCDPCSTTPPTNEELIKAGVFWSDNQATNTNVMPRGRRRFSSGTFVTRLHVRYNRSKFAEDLVFQQTSNRDTFQGRYIMTHPYRGAMTCSAANSYRQTVADRQRQEAQNLSQLTGWSLTDIQRKIQPLAAQPSAGSDGKFWPW